LDSAATPTVALLHIRADSSNCLLLFVSVITNVHSGQGLIPHEWGTLQVLERQEQEDREGRSEGEEERDTQSRGRQR
jgi:hypothetical protein